MSTLIEEWDYAVSADLVRETERYFPGIRPDVVNYMVHCSTSREFVYVETPKVASSTIKLMLQRAESADVTLSDSDRDVHSRDLSPIPPLSHTNLSLRDVFDGRYFTFAFVRSPFTRALSTYLDKIRNATRDAKKNRAAWLGLEPHGNVTFIDYLTSLTRGGLLLTDLHWMPQCRILNPNLVTYSFIGRFERLHSDLEQVARIIAPDLAGLSAVRVDSHRTASSEQATRLVGTRERDLILELYAEDFDRFGYSRDPRDLGG